MNSKSVDVVCDHCGRVFPTLGSLHFHTRSCVSTKRKLKEVLAKSKDIWEKKNKKRRLNREMDKENTPLLTQGRVDFNLDGAAPTSLGETCDRFESELGSLYRVSPFFLNVQSLSVQYLGPK